MIIDGLAVPELLVTLLEHGRWPRDSDEFHRQSDYPLVTAERLRSVAPNDYRIYLYAPPFRTIAKILVEPNEMFYSTCGALDELVPALAIQIGDFGIGADSTILLDYQFDRENPRVIRLDWQSGGEPDPVTKRFPVVTTWVEMASDFDSFVEALGT